MRPLDAPATAEDRDYWTNIYSPDNDTATLAILTTANNLIWSQQIHRHDPLAFHTDRSVQPEELPRIEISLDEIYPERGKDIAIVGALDPGSPARYQDRLRQLHKTAYYFALNDATGQTRLSIASFVPDSNRVESYTRHFHGSTGEYLRRYPLERAV